MSITVEQEQRVLNLMDLLVISGQRVFQAIQDHNRLKAIAEQEGVKPEDMVLADRMFSQYVNLSDPKPRSS